MKKVHSEVDTIIAEASTWITRLETGELSVTELALFREWTQRSPRHTAEINRLAHLSIDLERLADFPLQKTDANIDTIPIEHASIRSRWSTRVLGVSGVAAALLMAVVLVLLWPAQNDTNGPLTTLVGGYLERELSDGSLVRLNTNSRVTVAYDKAHRAIHLQQGEAYFKVSHDDDRPFVVRTNNREVLALGTAFVVRLQDEEFRVMVTEGRVAINQQLDAAQHRVQGRAPISPAPLAAPILLQAGQNFDDSAKSTQPVTQVAEPEVQRRLAWQRGLVEFTDTPLDEVIEEVSRYTNLNIRFDDAELRDVRFGGMFPTGEIHRLFGVLESTYSIDVAYADESTVTLTSKGKD